MKKKSSLILDNEFLLYCEINGIDNIDKLAKETFERGFSLLKYGETPTGNSTIKEKIVEKIVEITNNDEIVKLTTKNLELETELKNIKQSLEKFNKATYMKNSDLGSLYDE
jgi:uncharacterized protein YfbU (UPF0304 family)